MALTEDQAKALRAPFHPDEIGKLPKLTCPDCSKKQCSRHQKQQCRECGGYHSTAAIHLDYAGHAEVTDRLLEVDPEWDWEPLAVDEHGMPLLDRNGGMWIRLIIGGTAKKGYGDAPGKQGGNAIKEVIGDAIRNAAMRFGVGLDLWRKTERHERVEQQNNPEPDVPDGRIIGRGDFRVDRDQWTARVAAAEDQPTVDAAKSALTTLHEQAAGDEQLLSILMPAIQRVRARIEKEATRVQPTVPADDPHGQQMHENQRDAVKEWAASRGMGATPPPAQDTPRDWEAEIEKAEAGGDLDTLDRLGVQASDEGRSTIHAKVTAAARRVSRGREHAGGTGRAEGGVGVAGSAVGGPAREYTSEEKQARAKLRASINRHVKVGNVNGLADDVMRARNAGWHDIADAAERDQQEIIDSIRALDESGGAA